MRACVDGAGQQELDLGVEAVVPVDRINDVADWRNGRLPVATEPSTVVTVPGRTTSTSSRLLDEALGQLWLVTRL
ncbi:hypothetical protein AB0B25_22630 [Nocardia sp. NPDC049190]|uniref:hypothetical protein n=1 Tax=Nocardia sp. NPDC049190 TaxID=3155650 RepID=UPI0034030FB2